MESYFHEPTGPGTGQEPPEQRQIDAASVRRAEKSGRMAYTQRVHPRKTPGEPVLHGRQRPTPELATQYGRPPERRLESHANDRDAEATQQLADDFADGRKHLDILMPVEMRGPQAVSADQLHLLLQFRANCGAKLPAVFLQPSE